MPRNHTKRSCCGQSNHPKDYVCKKHKKEYGHVRVKCARTPVDPGGVIRGDGTSVGPDVQMELPPWLLRLETEINEMADGVEKQEKLLAFIQGLQSEGFAYDTLIIARDIEESVPLKERLLHSQNYLIQAQAFEALGEARAAKTSIKMATRLANGRAVRSRLDAAFERVLSPADVTDS